MALLLLGLQPVATAQEATDTMATAQEATDTMAAREQKPGLVKQVLERFSKSYGYFDERYVRKPPTKLIVTLKGKAQQAGVSINDFSEFENDWGLSNSTQTDIQLQERVCRKVGIYLTYSGIQAGGGMKVGRKSAERDISLYLSKLSPYYGLIGRYFNIKDKVTSDIYGMKDRPAHPPLPSATQLHCHSGHGAEHRPPRLRCQVPLRQLPLQHRLTDR